MQDYKVCNNAMMSSTRYLIIDQLEAMNNFINAEMAIGPGDSHYSGFDYEEGYRSIADHVGCSLEEVIAVANEGNDYDLPF